MKIELKEGQNIFFTSDTHFNHVNICKGTSQWEPKDQCRDFGGLDDMDSTVINNINSMVKEDDILFHLGDFSFNGFDNILKFRQQINCKNIHLILGNHDHHIKNNKHGIQSIFSSVSKREELQIVWYSDRMMLGFGDIVNKKTINLVLHHFPISSWEDMSKGHYHLFGHLHLPSNLKVREGRAMDVGIDGNNYFPYSLNDIIRFLRDQPIRNITIPQDHHQI